ncbi:hypothetical protein GALMADRAFT_1213462 [Galerina marginata CBS 339.88]|uniref:Uncharacterized protein n=1 Tax=Galerina marginata (strain CBS 339.88) TaxID=685588 RepID=A0A067SE54_GALM3|nr:hypothetical protein GALMADRAFT_1213462 [Galerina marginata CBS 339.88]
MSSLLTTYLFACRLGILTPPAPNTGSTNVDLKEAKSRIGELHYESWLLEEQLVRKAVAAASRNNRAFLFET